MILVFYIIFAIHLNSSNVVLNSIFQDHLITQKLPISKVRRKLPQINQNFKGATFRHIDAKEQTDTSNRDVIMVPTTFVDSSCTLPVKL